MYPLFFFNHQTELSHMFTQETQLEFFFSVSLTEALFYIICIHKYLQPAVNPVNRYYHEQASILGKQYSLAQSHCL